MLFFQELYDSMQLIMAKSNDPTNFDKEAFDKAVELFKLDKGSGFISHKELVELVV